MRILAGGCIPSDLLRGAQYESEWRQSNERTAGQHYNCTNDVVLQDVRTRRNDHVGVQAVMPDIRGRREDVDSADVSSGVAPMDSADELAAEPLGAELLRFGH